MENKYVVNGDCYNPFHYAVDFETCSCGLKIGTDMREKMRVDQQIQDERQTEEINRIQAMFTAIDTNSDWSKMMSQVFSDYLGGSESEDGIPRIAADMFTKTEKIWWCVYILILVSILSIICWNIAVTVLWFLFGIALCLGICTMGKFVGE